MSQTQRPRHYRLDLKETSASTGNFAAVPQNLPTLEAGLAYLRMHPNDSFMHAHLMECILKMGLQSVLALLKSIVDRYRPAMAAAGLRRWPLEKTIAHAMARLSILDIFEGSEMRHQSSLSRYALLRKWRFHHMVKSGKLKYTLSSTQTSYGRGLSLEAARASCLMEVAERCSAFVGVAENSIVGTRRPHPVVHGSLSTLEGSGYPLLDPNGLGLEVPYRDEPLYWMEGERSTAEGTEPIWVPVQCVYLFSNLDERSLFSGLGSTGLASGNTLAEARLSAVYEVLERDSEAVNPYHPSRCFRIYSKDTRMSALFEDYRARGIHLRIRFHLCGYHPEGSGYPRRQSTDSGHGDDGGLRPILPDQFSAI